MDIITAKSLIETKIKSQTDDLAVLTLAKDILENTFQAEFTARDTAVEEANRLATEKSAVIQEKTEAIISLNEEKTAHATTKEELLVAVSAHEDTQSKLDEKIAKIDTIVVPVSELVDSMTDEEKTNHADILPVIVEAIAPLEP